MKSAGIIYLVACFCLTHGQQYRLVPTCSDEQLDPNNPVALKGDKGDKGIPGKAGPPGFGAKGVKGEIGNCTRFSRDLNARLDNIEATLQLLIERTRPTTCAASNENGVQVLRNGNKVYCDQRWTVFQRRFDGSVSFERSWQEYKMGFGNVSGEFWMGLEQIHQLTRNGNYCQLRVDLWDFDDNFAYAEYSSFSVESEATNYVLHVNGYSGTAGNSLIDSATLHNNQPFTTFDRDNDNWIRNCATHSTYIRGGWWHNSCFRAALNNQWGRSVGAWTRIVWNGWKGSNEALKSTAMKLRCG